MGLLFAIVLFGAFLAVVFVLPAFHYWRRLNAEADAFTLEEWELFRRWVWTGTLVPFALWLFFNTGFITAPVWPTVAPLNAGLTAWCKSFEHPALAGAFLISSYWAGITFAWLLWRVRGLVASQQVFFGLCGAWCLLLIPVALLLVGAGGWSAAGLSLTVLFLPLVHFTLALDRARPPMAPTYSRALAKINFGKYTEAEQEVIRELEECEDDFNGWTMLAELYATHFNDLPAAEATVRELCEQPSTTLAQVSIALHRLADWQLKIGHDPVRACQSLEQICARMPGTHLAKMAAQRIEQLPQTRAELLERERGKPVPLPQGMEDGNAPALELPSEQAVTLANQCVDLLRKNPDDAGTREKFARLLAENLDRPATGIEQIELLLAMPNQSQKKRAAWMMMSAAWHARYLNDSERAKQIYAEVLSDFRDTPQAFVAQQRLNLIRLESRFGRRLAGQSQAST
jgi:hypothetical protein